MNNADIYSVTNEHWKEMVRGNPGTRRRAILAHLVVSRVNPRSDRILKRLLTKQLAIDDSGNIATLVSNPLFQLIVNLQQNSVGPSLIVGTKDDERLKGTDEGDTLDGGAGNDTLDGGEGRDRYLFGYGSGHDIIDSYKTQYDEVVFRSKVKPSDLQLVIERDDLIIKLDDGKDSLRIDRALSDVRRKRLNIYCFAGGKTLTLADLFHRGAKIPELRDGYALHNAVRDQHVFKATLIMAAGARVNRPDKSGETALHIAARQGNATILKMLLERGDVNVNALDKLQETALHKAAKTSRKQNVELLLNAPLMKVNAKNKYGKTAFDLADHPEVQYVMKWGGGLGTKPGLFAKVYRYFYEYGKKVAEKS